MAQLAIIVTSFEKINSKMKKKVPSTVAERFQMI